jgi:pimeloyl-ACP methyl ester carboxylesterase
MPYVTVDGQRVFYQVDRDDSKNAHPPLLLVHGAGGTHLHWSPQLRHLPGFDVYALDLPGHGRSEGTGRRSIAAYREVVHNLVRELGLERFVLAGHSMGGAIAQDFALTYPDTLAGLILVGSGARLRVAPAILEGLRADFPATVRLLADYAYGASPSGHMLQLYVERLLDNDPQVVYGDFLACDAFDLMGQVSRIKVPTLIICGEADRLTPPKYSQYLREQIPNSELHLFSGAGHMVMWEQPDGVARLIAGFMARLAPVLVTS